MNFNYDIIRDRFGEDAVLAAPIADSIAECRDKSLGHVVVVMIACGRNAVGSLPDDLGELVHKVLAVGGKIAIGKVGGKGKYNVGLLSRKIKALFVRYLRLVGEYCGNARTEVSAEYLLISVMGYLYKFLDGRL